MQKYSIVVNLGYQGSKPLGLTGTGECNLVSDNVRLMGTVGAVSVLLVHTVPVRIVHVIVGCELVISGLGGGHLAPLDIDLLSKDIENM